MPRADEALSGFAKGPFIKDVRKIFGPFDPLLPLVRIFVALFVRKIGRFFDPLSPLVRTSFMNGPLL